jgi:hypothetical protein
MVAVSLTLHTTIGASQAAGSTTNQPEELLSKGNPMGKNKSRTRFQPGPHGGCEALLYEFRDPLALFFLNALTLFGCQHKGLNCPILAKTA